MILGSKASTYAILAVIEIARQEAEHRGHGAASIRAAELIAALDQAMLTRAATRDRQATGRNA